MGVSGRQRDGKAVLGTALEVAGTLAEEEVRPAAAVGATVVVETPVIEIVTELGIWKSHSFVGYCQASLACWDAKL